MPMLIYEVNLAVDDEVAGDYAEFLRRHIPEVIGAGGFERAHWWKRDLRDEGIAVSTGQTHWTIHYEVRNREILEKYLSGPAAAMRADAIVRFGGRFSATRRVLEPVR